MANFVVSKSESLSLLNFAAELLPFHSFNLVFRIAKIFAPIQFSNEFGFLIGNFSILAKYLVCSLSLSLALSPLFGSFVLFKFTHSPKLSRVHLMSSCCVQNFNLSFLFIAFGRFGISRNYVLLMTENDLYELKIAENLLYFDQF